MNGGCLGLVTSDSWLDVDYGRHIQNAFLAKTKIIAIIESKVERWFPDASINTAITIVERAEKLEDRESNILKFVKLKVPLGKIIPPTDNELERMKNAEKLVNLIQSTHDFYEDDEITVYPKGQKEIQSDGYDSDKKKYVGSGWGKYLRITKPIHDILLKVGPRLVKLEELSDIELGYTTGYNHFFYVSTDKAKGLEQRFLVPIIKSPKDCNSIIVSRDNSHLFIFMVDLDRPQIKGTKALTYIQQGEAQGIHKRAFFKKKKTWYRISNKEPPLILHPNLFWERHAVFYNEPRLHIDKKLIGVTPHDKELGRALCAYLNSTFAILLRELTGRTPLGEGALDISTNDLKRMPVLDLRKIDEKTLEHFNRQLNSISKQMVGTLFEELGARKVDEFEIAKVREDRKQLDELVFNVLGLDGNEISTIYKTTIDLLRSRKERARSVGKVAKRKKPEAITLAEGIIKEIDISSIKDFPDDYIRGLDFEMREIPEATEASVDATKKLTKFFAVARFGFDEMAFDKHYTDGSNDGGIDLFNTEDNTHFILQSKFSKSPQNVDENSIMDEIWKIDKSFLKVGSPPLMIIRFTPLRFLIIFSISLSVGSEINSDSLQ